MAGKLQARAPLAAVQRPPAGACAIQLTRGVVAWVDDEDLESVSAHKWHAVPNRNGKVWYARTNIKLFTKRDNGRFRQRPLAMHTLILGAEPGVQCDHIQHQPASVKVVDNRRKNLRVATSAENARNRPKLGNGVGQFKGTWPNKSKYIADIKAHGRSQKMGSYTQEVEAAYAYDMAALYFFGRHACTNFPLEGSHHPLRKRHELSKPEIAKVAWRVMERLAITDRARLIAGPTN